MGKCPWRILQKQGVRHQVLFWQLRVAWCLAVPGTLPLRTRLLLSPAALWCLHLPPSTTCCLRLAPGAPGHTLAILWWSLERSACSLHSLAPPPAPYCPCYSLAPRPAP